MCNTCVCSCVRVGVCVCVCMCVVCMDIIMYTCTCMSVSVVHKELNMPLGGSWICLNSGNVERFGEETFNGKGSDFSHGYNTDAVQLAVLCRCSSFNQRSKTCKAH